MTISTKEIIIFTIILVFTISFFFQQDAFASQNVGVGIQAPTEPPAKPRTNIEIQNVTIAIIGVKTSNICTEANAADYYFVLKRISLDDYHKPYGPWFDISGPVKNTIVCDNMIPVYVDADNYITDYVQYRIVATNDFGSKDGKIRNVDFRNEPPVIIINGTSTTILFDEVYVNPEALCVDIEDGNYPTRTYDSVGSAPGDYILTYSCHVDPETKLATSDSITITRLAEDNQPINVVKKKGSGGCSDCIPPTLGLNKQGKRIVEDGFTYNGQTVNVESYYTDFPLINATVGEINHVELKIYENQGIHNIKRVQLGLGVLEIGSPLSYAEVILQFELDHFNGTSIDELIITDKQNLIDNNSTDASFDVGPCMEGNTALCLFMDIQYSYREAPLYNVMSVHTMDSKRNNQASFFNEGVGVLGESLNEAPTHILFNKKTSQQTENLWLELVRIDKVENIWEDKDGYQYTFNHADTWRALTSAPLLPDKDKPVSVMTRYHSDFIDMIQREQELAQEIFDEKYVHLN